MSLDPWLLAAAVIGLAGIAVWWVWALNRDTNKRIDTLATTTRNNSGAIIQLQTTVADTPLQVHQPMPTVTKVTATISGDRPLQPHTPNDRQRCAQDADQTLRLGRPPAMTDVAAAITNAGRPLTRAAITEQLGRDARTEIREQLLAGTLTMVRTTHDSDPAYWPAGDTQRMGRMSVLPGVSQ